MSTSNIDPKEIVLEVALSKGYLDDSLIYETILSKDLRTTMVDLAYYLLDQSRVEVVNGSELILFYQDTSLDQLTADNKVENIEMNLFITKRSFLEIMTEWFWKKDATDSNLSTGNVFEGSKHSYIMQYLFTSYSYDPYIKSEIADNLFVIFNQYLLFESIAGCLKRELINEVTIEDVFCYDTVENYIITKGKTKE